MEARKTFCPASKQGLLLLGTLLLAPAAKAQVIGIQGFYAQSSDFWKQVDRLEDSADTAQIMAQMFEETQGEASEGMASGGLYYASNGAPLNLSFLDRGIVSLEVEAVAGGYIRNRISPEIAGYATWAGSITTGVQRVLPVDESGWGATGLITTGIGKQRVIRGEVTSYLSEAEEDSSSLFYQGFDAGLEFQSIWGDGLRFRSGYFFMPTYFYSQSDDTANIYEINDSRWSLRWRTQFEFTARTSDFGQGAVELGGQVISGPQPIPMPVLPRLWDGVHDIDPAPAFGSLVGVGGVGRLVSGSRNYSLETFGGFYGGYWGAGAGLRLHVFHIRAGTFGVEQSSNYQLYETRVNFVDGGFAYAW
ncbi:MAG TPA: hypothetical protein VM901_03650 [Bdellovibrionota bacterium]|nr:hypothetical protein [Bdellovibrionota bacterium]